jgi:hypothetical protein
MLLHRSFVLLIVFSTLFSVICSCNTRACVLLKGTGEGNLRNEWQLGAFTAEMPAYPVL